MSNEESTAGTGIGRRPARQGVGGSPVGSTLSIVLAVVAVVAGFLILRNITDDGSSGGAAATPDSESGSTTTLVDPNAGSTTTTTTTTVPFVTEGASVLVANANTIGGSAGNMTRTLEAAGFTMEEPTNATGPNLTDTEVYFDPSIAAAEQVAQSVGLLMGDDTVEPVADPPPTSSGSLGDAGVLVMLGDNQANLTLEQLEEAAGLSAATGAAPEPSAGDAPADTTADATVDATDDTTADG